MKKFLIFAALLILGVSNAPARADVKLDSLKLPEGFKISVWAEVADARSLAVGPDFVIVGSMGKTVQAVPFDPATYAAGEPVVLTESLSVPNGVALLDGVLYIAEQPRVVRWGDKPFSLAEPVQEPVQVGPNLPDKAWHGWRYITAGPDGLLYVSLGSPCNICVPESPEGSVVRMQRDGSGFEVYATGVRQSVGLTFHPQTGDLFFTDNGADWMGDNTPSGELNRATAAGQHFGFPHYGGGRSVTKDFRKQAPPADAQFPAMEFQAHTANLGVLFYQGDMFPADYKLDGFTAQHGSWNRRVPIGYRLMRVRFDAAGEAMSKEVFIRGWLRKGRPWGRPVDLKELPDGSLLLSDDLAGVIYRITYEAP